MSLLYPNGAEFAFSILDDTDDTTVSNGKPIYDLLEQLGLRTTKTVWSFDSPKEEQGPYFAGQTLEAEDYREWCQHLSQAGFEIAFHNARMSSSKRNDTIDALNLIESLFRKPVRLHCNHGQNRENLYWGDKRYQSTIFRVIFALLPGLTRSERYEGDSISSPYYWADIAAERLSYMRMLAFNSLDCNCLSPKGPYRDSRKVPSPIFFNTADAPDVHAFNALVNKQSLDQLQRTRGWAIVSTHFGKGFYKDGKINEEFVQTIKDLGNRPGWYVPVSELLDYLVAEIGVRQIGSVKRFCMEGAHIIDRMAKEIL